MKITKVLVVNKHSPHFYFHAIFISAYSAVRVKNFNLYMIGRNIYNYSDNYVFAGKESNREANDSFGKGFHALIAHMLNRLMTGRCPHKSLQLRPKFPRFFSKIASIYKKKCYIKRT